MCLKARTRHYSARFRRLLGVGTDRTHQTAEYSLWWVLTDTFNGLIHAQTEQCLPTTRNCRTHTHASTCEKDNAHSTNGSDVPRTLRYGEKKFLIPVTEYILSMVQGIYVTVYAETNHMSAKLILRYGRS